MLCHTAFGLKVELYQIYIGGSRNYCYLSNTEKDNVPESYAVFAEIHCCNFQ